MNEQEETIDLRMLLKVFTEHIIPIVIATVFAAGIGFSLAKFIIPKRYTSEAMMYVENSSGKQDDSAININDLNAAQKLVNTCQILFTSDHIFSELNDCIGGKYKNDALKKMIKIESVNNTEILRISAETKDPNESHDIVEKLIELSVNEFKRIIKNGSIETVSSPTLPEKHNFPSATIFTVVAALIGAVASYFLFLIKEMFDTKLKPDDDLTQIYDLPVYAEILDFETAGKAGYKYSKYGDYGGYDVQPDDRSSGEGHRHSGNKKKQDEGSDDPDDKDT